MILEFIINVFLSAHCSARFLPAPLSNAPVHHEVCFSLFGRRYLTKKIKKQYTKQCIDNILNFLANKRINYHYYHYYYFVVKVYFYLKYGAIRLESQHANHAKTLLLLFSLLCISSSHSTASYI